MAIDDVRAAGGGAAAGLPTRSAPANPKSPEGQELPLPGNLAAGTPAASAHPAADIRDAVSQANHYVQSLRRDLHFTVDEDSGQTVIKVLDSETKEVIRQIPPDEMLALARRLLQMDDMPLLTMKA